MKRWVSAQADVGGWAMWEQVQITPTHAPLVRQPPRAPTSSCSSCSRMACKKARRSKPEDFWSNMPAWMTFWSTFSLYLAAARIFSSTLLTVQRRSTRTSFCWPIRWALSWACKSCRSAHTWLAPYISLDSRCIHSIHCHNWGLRWCKHICIWVPDVGSSRCQRWWLCQQTAGWGPDLRPWCWAGTQSTQRLGHWMSSAACHGPLPWWFLREGIRALKKVFIPCSIWLGDSTSLIKILKRMAIMH